MKTTVSSKGQIVLPAELRQQDAIEPGQEFDIERLDRGEYRLVRRKPPANDGVVELVAPVDGLATAVDAWFDRTLARWSAEALRHAVRAVRAPLVDAVTRGLPAAEQIYLDELMRSRDAVEGIQAFLEKRSPRWTDE